MATEKLHTELANVGENLLFPESCIEGLSQKHLMFAHIEKDFNLAVHSFPW